MTPPPASATASTHAVAPEPAPNSFVADHDDVEATQVAAGQQASVTTVEPAPRTFFVGRDEVTVDELAAEIDALADEIAGSDDVRADYLALVDAAGLVDSDALYRDYVRVKLAFEATRDGGWWNLSWDITNEQPNSEQIWKQWKTAEVGEDHRPSAIAECDELSALFAFLARRLSVHGIGLFWPTGNHVVAVWTVDGVQTTSGSSVRIVVPTSQIFLSSDDSLGTTGFDPWTQKTIFEYRRRDVKGSHRLSGDLARFFVAQIAQHGHKSQAQLQRERNARAARLTTS
mgnify:CR=1 FL=1